jgi:hypothetical protein
MGCVRYSVSGNTTIQVQGMQDLCAETLCRGMTCVAYMTCVQELADLVADIDSWNGMSASIQMSG